MCNHDGGASAHRLRECGLDDCLVLGIDVRGRFIQDQDRRVLQEGAGDRQSLPLSAREAQATFADNRAVARG